VKAPADKGMDGRPTVSVLPRVTAVSTASLRVFAWVLWPVRLKG